MKTIKYISLFVSLLLVVASCTSDLDGVTYHPDNVVKGELKNNLEESYVLLKDDETKAFNKFEWSAFDFGYPAAVNYTIEVDLAGKNFENAAEVASSKTSNVETTIAMINKAMIYELQKQYGFEDETAQDVEFRLRASISNAAEDVYSNTIKSSITPYPMAILSENLYMIGQDFGDWNWSDKGIVEMIPVHSKAGHFWAIKYITAGAGFKWAEAKNWDEGTNNFAKLKKMIGYEESGGNAVVATSGLYMIYVDLENEQIAIETAQVYGIGGAFGKDDWSEGKHLFAVSGSEASIVTKEASPELRMYAGSSIAVSDWWTREFIVLNGAIEYRGAGDDQDRVAVTAGQTVTLDFKTEKGTIK